MCFSATASFVAATVLIGLGGIAAQRTQRVAEIPYALIPVWFGVQQLLEGALWLTFANPQSGCLNTWLTQGFSVFSQVVWPLYIPLAVWLLEPRGWRRSFIAAIAVAGAGVSLFLLWYLVQVPAVAVVNGNHIAYIFPHFHEPLATTLYVLGACVSPLLARFAWVRWFGVLVTVALLATAFWYAQWFTSVWCFFAAALSSVIVIHFMRRPHYRVVL